MRHHELLSRFVSSFFLVIAGVCITTDLDTLLYHMNNARYLRELDFARVDFYERTGLYKKIRQKGGAVVQGACTIRYRRFVRPFSVFKITSKVNGRKGWCILNCTCTRDLVTLISSLINISLLNLLLRWPSYCYIMRNFIIYAYCAPKT
jgi:hypothetical protein